MSAVEKTKPEGRPAMCPVGVGAGFKQGSEPAAGGEEGV